ncbi:MAG: GntR family transcriptional regulator [Porticoccaceae bacterium]|nr:GntR family transcriptional regulator [Porticoccaceae bacterium]
MKPTTGDILFSHSQRNKVSEEAPSPLYHQLYRLIKSYIIDGTFHHGEKLPSERELAEAFDVSRITVKRAVNELAAEDLVERGRGKGTHVTHKYTPKPVQAPLLGVLEEIDSIAQNSVAQVIDCRVIVPPQTIRGEFSIDGNESLFHLVRTRERAGAIFGYFDSWSAGVDMPDSTDIFINQSRHQYFRESGMNVSHINQTISAVPASETIAAYLEIEVGFPLLSLVRRSYYLQNDKEVLVDYLLALYNTELFQYQMDLKLD